MELRRWLSPSPSSQRSDTSMLIEKALQKMREAAAGQTGAHQILPVTQEPQRRVAREARVNPNIPKPQFPQVSIDASVAQNRRVLLPELVNLDGAQHRAEAAYRMLRTRLLQQMRNNRWTSLAFTSPGPGEGKSLTALNLALSIARDKSFDVFLLDLDMRNPSILAYLGGRPRSEVTQYFAGE